MPPYFSTLQLPCFTKVQINLWQLKSDHHWCWTLRAARKWVCLSGTWNLGM